MGQSIDTSVEAIGRELRETYGGVIHLDQPVFFNSAGGIMYHVKVFAMTPREYIIICGTSIGSAGHSGRHPVAFWDTILSGEARYMHQNELTRRSYPQGSRVFVDRWQAATIHFPDHCWMLEYARGAMIGLLPFGLANTLFNTLDFASAYRTLGVYSRLTWRYFQERGQEHSVPSTAARDVPPVENA